MTSSINHNKAIIAYLLLFSLLLVAVNVFLIYKEWGKQFPAFMEYSENELNLIESFSISPVLEHKFSTVAEFIRLWGEKKKDIVDIKLYSQHNHLLASFSRKVANKKVKTFQRNVSFMGKHLLSIRLIKTYNPVVNQLKSFIASLVLQSILIVGLFGVILWFSLKKLAIQPLELEISRREIAENHLQYSNELLEKKVLERTRDLGQEKEHLAVTLRCIGEGVIAVDIDNNITVINKASEKITGWSHQQAFGKPIGDILLVINEKTGLRDKKLLAKMLSFGNENDPKNYLIKSSKTVKPNYIEMSNAPIYDDQKNRIGAVLVFRDITEKLLTEQAMIKTERLESLGILAGGIAHDFNNLLAIIRGNVELTSTCFEQKSQINTYVNRSIDAINRAKKLTKQLLTFSKGGSPVKQTVSIAEMIVGTAHFVLDGSSIELKTKVDKNLWQVDIDVNQMNQVIQNIIINAKYAMPDGGEISIECENIESSLLNQKGIKITFSDNGVGIPAEMIDKIFDPYFTTKQTGNGLGLAICHSIIQKHGGNMAVQSVANQGTTFTLMLPASTPQVDVTTETVALSQSVIAFHHPLRILMMDDEVMIANLIREMLELLGHEVVTTTDGQEAIDEYKISIKQQCIFDMVLLDLTVPGRLNGKETARELLKLNPSVKIIVSSGYFDDPVMTHYQDYGFKAALSKPVQLEELTDTINVLIHEV
ncbi:MAG: response regulator [Methylococcales bacterium]|jgi:two-component system, cell cycle sensor histidine kinase and response regulator CckA|nr:response regulator [Methylococcales bacterium]MBT7409503.1 response regulator [Methylococcales bacterium]